jgi:hypothetical protein
MGIWLSPPNGVALSATFPSQYDDACVRLLHEFSARPCEAAGKPQWTFFWPAIGCQFRPGKGLLIVGRAVNGWTDGWAEGDHPSTEVAREVLVNEQRETQHADGEHCPMSWVVSHCNLPSPADPMAKRPYNTNASPFWRASRAFAGRAGFVGDDGADWSCHLAWTNLYKVAPVRGGNPNLRTRERQRKACIDLFELELDTLSPRCVLVLTGPDWYRGFAPSVAMASQRGGFVHAVGRRGASTFILADHPQTRPEKEFVGDLLRAWSQRDSR